MRLDAWPIAMGMAFRGLGILSRLGGDVRVVSFRWVVLALGFTSFGGAGAWAQRADDNAVASADDAFGTTIGNETIGLYDSRNARGFNPQTSGNARIEGMYFDRPSTGPGDLIVDRLMAGSSVRVGINALSFPFPAPSAVVDVKLRAPGDKQVTSVVASYGPYDQTGLEIDTQIPVIPGVLSIGGGVERTRYVNDMRNDADDSSYAGILRWTPNDSVELISFWGRANRKRSEGQPFIYVGGDYLPPRQPRGVDFAQEWNQWEQYDTNYGAVGRARLSSAWTLRAGLFRATYDRRKNYITFFNNTQPDGTTSVTFSASLPVLIETTSGEVQAQGVYSEGPRRHSFYFMARGREGGRPSGGGASHFYGTANINTMPQVPEPTWTYDPLGYDAIKQMTGGVQYFGQWRGVGEVNVGVQKTSYKRTLTHPIDPDQGVKLQPWLYNGSISFQPSTDLTLFTSYAKGLEDGGSTPQSARNRGEAVPATITRQVDAGLAYDLAPGLKMNASVFQISKPFFERDATNLYTVVGDLKHQGFEFSFTGEPIDGLTVVAGTVLLKARVSGDLVTQGLLGNIPPGRDSRAARLDLNYVVPALDGLSLDSQIEYTDRGRGASLNRANIPPRTVISLGMRYRFNVFGASATLRARVQNLTNVYSWDLQGGNNFFFQYLAPRRFSASLSADF